MAMTAVPPSFHTDDLRARLDRPHIAETGERVVRSALWPTLRKDLRPTVEELAASAEPTLRRVPAMDDRERTYFQSFY